MAYIWAQFETVPEPSLVNFVTDKNCSITKLEIIFGPHSLTRGPIITRHMDK